MSPVPDQPDKKSPLDLLKRIWDSLKSAKKVPAYFLSILVLFVVPVAALIKMCWKQTAKKPFFLSVGVICAIGWAWSWTVSKNGWWTFGERYMLGVEVIPHLPLEELLFYPLGGAFCILVYIAICKYSVRIQPLMHWVFLLAGTLVFGFLAWRYRANGPHYLTSQLIVYNLATGILLAPYVAKHVNLIGVAAPVAVLGTIGFFWDYVAFKYGWWAYHAITQIKISIVPIDDFNFFLYAPTSAVSLYAAFCRLFRKPQIGPG